MNNTCKQKPSIFFILFC